MFTKSFFTFFPPPKFLDEPYAGIDISDSAVHCIQFDRKLKIAKYAVRTLSAGIVEAGFIKEKEKLIAIVTDIARELNIDRVRASLPEEEMYIFKTQVPANVDRKMMAQNIEFKLEENVPLKPSDAIFYFDIIRGTESAQMISASVAVAPKKVVETYMEILNAAGLTVISFEMQARALSRAFMRKVKEKKETDCKTVLIVQIMDKKIGMYIIYDGVACFTSTIMRGENLEESIRIETEKIRDYWAERGEGRKEIDCIFVSGKDALTSDLLGRISPASNIDVEVASVWLNAFSTEEYVSPITAEDSLDYAVAVGLALPI